MSAVRRAEKKRGLARWVAAGAGCVALVGIFLFSVLRTNPEDLLDAATLDNAQMKTIATKLLLHEKPLIRERAAARLTKAGPAAVSVLKEVSLKTSDPKLLQAAMVVLIGIDREAAVSTLKTLIDSPDIEIRRAAVSSADQCDDPRAIEILAKAMQDQDPGVRLRATNALNNKPSREGVQALRAAQRDPDPKVRRHAERALRSISGR